MRGGLPSDRSCASTAGSPWYGTRSGTRATCHARPRRALDACGGRCRARWRIGSGSEPRSALMSAMARHSGRMRGRCGITSRRRSGGQRAGGCWAPSSMIRWYRQVWAAAGADFGSLIPRTLGGGGDVGGGRAAATLATMPAPYTLTDRLAALCLRTCPPRGGGSCRCPQAPGGLEGMAWATLTSARGAAQHHSPSAQSTRQSAAMHRRAT